MTATYHRPWGMEIVFVANKPGQRRPIHSFSCASRHNRAWALTLRPAEPWPPTAHFVGSGEADTDDLSPTRMELHPVWNATCLCMVTCPSDAPRSVRKRNTFLSPT